MAFFSQSAFVTIAEAEKRQLDSGGLLNGLSVTQWRDSQARRLQQPTAKRSKWPVPPAVGILYTCWETPKWESQYEVMECILNELRWLKRETTSSSCLIQSLAPSVLSGSIPLLRACDLWSKARDVDSESGERGSDGNIQPHLLSKMWLIRLPSLQQTIPWIDVRWRNTPVTFHWGNCSCFHLSGKNVKKSVRITKVQRSKSGGWLDKPWT